MVSLSQLTLNRNTDTGIDRIPGCNPNPNPNPNVTVGTNGKSLTPIRVRVGLDLGLGLGLGRRNHGKSLTAPSDLCTLYILPYTYYVYKLLTPPSQIYTLCNCKHMCILCKMNHP